MKLLQEILKPYFAEWQVESDITAVLKYWKNKRFDDLRHTQIWDSEIQIGYIKENTFITELCILNKPLHLYTEEEEKELLELLLTIKD